MIRQGTVTQTACVLKSRRAPGVCHHSSIGSDSAMHMLSLILFGTGCFLSPFPAAAAGAADVDEAYQRGYEAGVKAAINKETATAFFKKGFAAGKLAATGTAAAVDAYAPIDKFDAKPNFAPYNDGITYEFATPVLLTPLDIPADVHAGLRDDIHAQMLAAPVWEVSRSTKGSGAWRSEEILKWKSKHVEYLGQTILERMHRVFLMWNDGTTLPCTQSNLMPGIGSECLGPGAVFETELTMWAQALPAGGHNIVHTHQLDERSRNGRWSGVYYVEVPPCPHDDPDCGALEYFDTRGEQPVKGISEIRPLEYTRLVHPKAGQLLVFPADVRHRVKPYSGEGFRISIAFNINIERSHATGSKEFSLGSHSMTSDVGLSNIAVLTCIPIVSYAMGGWVKGAARYGAVGTKGRVICNTCAWKRPYPRQPQQHQQNDDAGKGAQAHNLAQQQAQTLAEPEEMAQQEEAANTAAPAVEPSPEAAADTVGKERSEL